LAHQSTTPPPRPTPTRPPTPAAIGLTVWLILCSSNRIQRKLGRVGIKVMTRMMGLILTSMAVQMIINGIKGAFGL
jgi:multiple antibiotic resistance protein